MKRNGKKNEQPVKLTREQENDYVNVYDSTE